MCIPCPLCTLFEELIHFVSYKRTKFVLKLIMLNFHLGFFYLHVCLADIRTLTFSYIQLLGQLTYFLPFTGEVSLMNLVQRL